MNQIDRDIRPNWLTGNPAGIETKYMLNMHIMPAPLADSAPANPSACFGPSAPSMLLLHAPKRIHECIHIVIY